jgi:hypothetical protein
MGKVLSSLQNLDDPKVDKKMLAVSLASRFFFPKLTTGCG